MANELTLSVNGANQVVSAAPETPLLFVLRNELKLSGPRLGCGMAQCGACSVLLDGEEVRACITPISYAVGKQVTTIEGLPAVWAMQKGLSAPDAANTLHPVQQAWIDEQVPQCGYCQSGMMIVAVQLLAKNPNPTVAQIKDAFTNTPPSPHLCRCGTYTAIIYAVQRAATVMRAGKQAAR
jgi:aerobic-type carbon monoxide dehydrogenase small subunit (CoxS/CutS family)